MKLSDESDWALSSAEEAFFREGAEMETAEPIGSFEDLDAGYERPSLWQRLLGKKR